MPTERSTFCIPNDAVLLGDGVRLLLIDVVDVNEMEGVASDVAEPLGDACEDALEDADDDTEDEAVGVIGLLYVIVLRPLSLTLLLTLGDARAVTLAALAVTAGVDDPLLDESVDCVLRADAVLSADGDALDCALTVDVSVAMLVTDADSDRERTAVCVALGVAEPDDEELAKEDAEILCAGEEDGRGVTESELVTEPLRVSNADADTLELSDALCVTLTDGVLLELGSALTVKERVKEGDAVAGAVDVTVRLNVGEKLPESDAVEFIDGVEPTDGATVKLSGAVALELIRGDDDKVPLTVSLALMRGDAELDPDTDDAGDPEIDAVQRGDADNAGENVEVPDAHPDVETVGESVAVAHADADADACAVAEVQCDDVRDTEGEPVERGDVDADPDTERVFTFVGDALVDPLTDPVMRAVRELDAEIVEERVPT